MESVLLRAIFLPASLVVAPRILFAQTQGEEALPFAFGPPGIPKPSHELLGDLLLKNKNPGDARGAFTASLARAPRRAQSLLGLIEAQVALGDKDGAAKTEAILREIRKGPESASASAGNPH